MAKLFFKYASMNSGKSIDLIRTAYNYEEKGFKVKVYKPAIDTKAGNNVSTRIGLEREVDALVYKDTKFIDLIDYDELDDIRCIFIDEAQFLTKEQVDELFVITKALNIPVIAYGLRCDFKNESFEGSRRLLEISESIGELKTLCICGETARYNARKINDEYVLDGEAVVIDGTKNIEYVPLCGDCYLQKVKKLDYEEYRKTNGFNS